MKPTMPEWQIPNDLQALLDADEGGMWEDHRWEPILLTVMSGTIYDGREIPLSWQIEFEPASEPFEKVNQEVKSLGVDPDGYGWANVINSVAMRHHPELVDELHFDDSEEAACVVWVESETTCKVLIQLAWSLIHGT